MSTLAAIQTQLVSSFRNLKASQQPTNRCKRDEGREESERKVRDEEEEEEEEKEGDVSLPQLLQHPTMPLRRPT